MEKRFELLACALALGAFLAVPAESDGQVSLEMYPERTGAKAGAGEDPLRVTFRGNVAAAGAGVALPAADLAGLAPHQAHVVGYIDALARGSREEIASFWSPSEREVIGARLEGDALRKVQSYHRRVSKLTFLGEVSYGPYVLVLVRMDLAGRPLYRSYPLKPEGRSFYLTDELARDHFFSGLSRALAEGLGAGSVKVLEAGRP